VESIGRVSTDADLVPPPQHHENIPDH